ncbi:MAG: cell division protein FtsZ [Alphaproteobacteria bacterium]
MALELDMPEKGNSDIVDNQGGMAKAPRILVLGVGGAGCNAVNNMLRPDSHYDQNSLEFVVANCDAQSLEQSICEKKLQLGEETTNGLGAGSNPEMGQAAAVESADTIRKQLEDVNMLFITAGMGGGTGTGASPEIARIAKELGILTVAVVTRPFDFEGTQRAQIAEAGIKELENVVDSLIVVPNQNLFLVADESTSFSDAFLIADQVLAQGVWGITSLMVRPGLVNLDFNDVRTAMHQGGRAMLGTGEAEGDNRAMEAARAAIANPLLETATLEGAKYVLINITGAKLGLFEVEQAFRHIREQVGPDATINYGAAIDNDLDGKMRVLVVATGVDASKIQSRKLQQKPQRPNVIRSAAEASHTQETTQEHTAHASAHPRNVEAPVASKEPQREAAADVFVPEQPITNRAVEDSNVELPNVDEQDENVAESRTRKLFDLATRNNNRKEEDDDLPEWFRNND